MIKIDINNFEQEKECFYQGEKYCVRDNGAVLRYPKDTNKPRPLDNKWTFGKIGNHGYLYIASKGIHRIVATAFHGENLSKDYIVDHIDTNKQNNRPENLRWLTKEDNILKNPNTIDKLQYITGYSIEELKENNWEKLHQCTSNKQDTTWMRPTTKEEAKNFHKRQEQWLNKKIELDEEGQKLYNQLLKICELQEAGRKRNNKMGEWVFEPFEEEDEVTTEESIEIYYNKSLTPNAYQDWRIPTEFPCCPDIITENPIEKYYQNLKKNKLFSKNQYYTSHVIKADFNKKNNCILVEVTSLNKDKTNYYSLFEIHYKYNYYIHYYKKQFETIDECDIIYDYILGKIPFDDQNPFLFRYEYI